MKVETWTVPYAILLNADIAAEEKKWDLVKEHLRKVFFCLCDLLSTLVEEVQQV